MTSISRSDLCNVFSSLSAMLDNRKWAKHISFLNSWRIPGRVSSNANIKPKHSERKAKLACTLSAAIFTTVSPLTAPRYHSQAAPRSSRPLSTSRAWSASSTWRTGRGWHAPRLWRRLPRRPPCSPPHWAASPSRRASGRTSSRAWSPSPTRPWPSSGSTTADPSRPAPGARLLAYPFPVGGRGGGA